MKWQAIASDTEQISAEAKASYTRKLEKDASVQIPHLWSDFIIDTTRHLHESQSNLEVNDDKKTGGISCLTKFDELHPDFLENNKPFLEYAIAKYDQRAAGYLSNAKNPFTKKYLSSKIGDYRMRLASQISQTEAKLIDGHRHSMAIESVEKLKNATYDNPELYANHLQDMTVAITSLALLPTEKDKMLQEAREELAEAAALGTLKNAPNAILRPNPNNMPLWQQHLTLEQRVKIQHQAETLLHHKQVMLQHQVNSLDVSNSASILANGSGIKGFGNMVHRAFAGNPAKLQEFKQREALYKQAFIIAQQLKTAPFSKGQEILQQIAPKSGDIDFAQKEKIYYTLLQEFDKQVTQAKDDPAKLVESLFVEEIPKDLPLPQRYLLRKQLQTQKGIPSYAQKYLMKNEREEFLQKMNSGDINQVKQTVDSIISLRDDTLGQYGLGVMEEILKDRDSEILVHFYAESKLYNRNRFEADGLLKMLSMKNQMFNGVFNSDEEKAFSKAIDNNANFKKWKNNLTRQDIQNEVEATRAEQGVKYLTKYLKNQHDLTIDKAVDMAVNKLITENYHDIPSKKLQIPKKIIANNKINDLDSSYIEASLADLQNGIILGTIPYDYNSSFAVQKEDIASKYAKARVEEALREGRWNLTSDKKSVYYTFPVIDGSYQPIMKAPDQILLFDLVELNNPASLERQKQKLLEIMQQSLMESY